MKNEKSFIGIMFVLNIGLGLVLADKSNADLILSNELVQESKVVESQDRIVAGTNYTIHANAFVNLLSKTEVDLNPGFSTQSGASFSAKIVEKFVQDTDGDGLPDYWEIAYFGHLGQNGLDDADGDSVTNSTEYSQGYNPSDVSNSKPVIRSMYPLPGTQGTPDSNGDVTVFVSYQSGVVNNTINGNDIQVFDERGNDITGSLTGLTFVGESMTFKIANAETRKYFYKLRLKDNQNNVWDVRLSIDVDAQPPVTTTSIKGGVFEEAVLVALDVNEEGAVIRYTVNGMEPILTEPGLVLAEAPVTLSISQTMTLKFQAVDAAGNVESVQTEVYQIGQRPQALNQPTGGWNSNGHTTVDWESRSNIQGYRLYRATGAIEKEILEQSRLAQHDAPTGFRLEIAPGTGDTTLMTSGDLYNDTTVAKGSTVWYSVTVVDANGTESILSELYAIDVPPDADTVAAPSALQAVANSVQWLKEQQHPTGYWGEKERIRTRATAEVILALVASGEAGMTVERGVQYLRGARIRTTEDLIYRLMALKILGRNTTLDRMILIERGKSWDGKDVSDAPLTAFGFGLTPDFWPDPATTAAAILYDNGIALPVNPNYRIGQGMSDVSMVTRNLNGEYRYGWVARRDHSVYVTAMAYRGLAVAVSVYAPDSPAIPYLEQAGDGHFGNGLLDTGAVLNWLVFAQSWSRTLAQSYVVEQLKSGGVWNPHWNGNHILTAFCTQALLANDVTPTAPPPVPPINRYLQDTSFDHIVSLEAENYQSILSQGGHYWALYTNPGASNGKAMEALPDSGGGAYTTYVTIAPMIGFEVEFNQTGTHYVWVRGRFPNGAGNSLHVGIDGVENTTADRINLSGQVNTWSWSRLTMPTSSGIFATVEIPSIGIHTVNIWMREDGVIVDKIVLTTNANLATPIGSGPNESQAGY